MREGYLTYNKVPGSEYGFYFRDNDFPWENHLIAKAELFLDSLERLGLIGEEDVDEF